MTIWKVQLVYKNFDFFLVTLETIYITSRNPQGLSNLTLTIFLTCHISNYNSQSHHYAQLGNALQKHDFAYSALIIDTLKGSIGRFYIFSAQRSQFYRGFAWTQFALIFPYGQKSMSTKRTDVHLIWKIIH